MASPTINAIIIGAPMNVATRQRIICFLPQNVQRDGLQKQNKD
jgi:hypothetical protein